MPIKDPVQRRAYQRDRYAAAKGRPRAIEGEVMTVDSGLLSSVVPQRSGGAYFAPVDEVIKRQGWKTYKDMVHDDQVRTCLSFKKTLIHGRMWELKPYNDSPEAEKVAKFVTWNLNKINMNAVFREALTALEFGFSLGELVWTRDAWEDGQYVCLEKIAHRDPQSLELKMDVHGNVMAAQQKDMAKNLEIKAEKFWLYSHNKRFGDPYGSSDLRPAFRPWWAKKYVINFWNVYLERMGAPMTTMKYPRGSSDDLKTNLKTILSNLSSKTEILIPEGVEIELVEATRGGTATYAEALAYHDHSIARAILMASIFGSGGENAKSTGSESQSFLQLRILFKMADAIAQELKESLMKQVVSQLVSLNFDGDEIMPKFIWQDYGQFEGMKVADTIRLLHAAGILDLDQEDVNYCRSVLGLPLRLEGDEEDEVIRPQANPPPADGTPPPSAPQGNERAKKGGDNTTKTTASTSRAPILKVQFIQDEN